MPQPAISVRVLPHPVATLRHHAQLVRDGQPPVPLTLGLRYTAHDPFAVSIALEACGASVHWTLSRETLLSGLHHHEGIGDVAAWPAPRHDAPTRLRIRLGPTGGCAIIQTDREVMAEWLDITLRLVPRDTERAHLDRDTFLSPLLDPY